MSQIISNVLMQPKPTDTVEHLTLVEKLVQENNLTVQYTAEGQEKDGYLQGVKRCIDIVKQHSDWVSVSERLPSESGNYLVYRYNGKTNNCEVTIEYFCAQSEWFKPYRSINNITHWRELPQPPSEVQA